MGQTPNAARCKILNPNVLLISNDETNKILTIKANDFLIIENEALGYHIRYLLEIFEYHYGRDAVYYAGKPAFEEMTGNTAKQHRWKKERELAYQGSNIHFFRSLVKNELQQNGFILLKNLQKTRLSDSLINAKIKQFSIHEKSKTNAVEQVSKKDSLDYWTKKRKELKTIEIPQTSSVLADTLITKYDDFFKSMRLADELIVVFTKEQELKDLAFSIYRQARPADYKHFQTSIIKRIAPKVLLYADGRLVDPKSVFYNGVWAYQKMADTVPIDYVSSATQ